jgi:transcriptional regulator with XRE-family HTH domain
MTSDAVGLWQWMASELKRLRLAAGLTQADAADALGSRVPMISLIESAQRAVRENDLRKLLQLYGVAEADWSGYLDAAASLHRNPAGNETPRLVDDGEAVRVAVRDALRFTNRALRIVDQRRDRSVYNLLGEVQRSLEAVNEPGPAGSSSASKAAGP